MDKRDEKSDTVAFLASVPIFLKKYSQACVCGSYPDQPVHVCSLTTVTAGHGEISQQPSGHLGRQQVICKFQFVHTTVATILFISWTIFKLS